MLGLMLGVMHVHAACVAMKAASTRWNSWPYHGPQVGQPAKLAAQVGPASTVKQDVQWQQRLQAQKWAGCLDPADVPFTLTYSSTIHCSGRPWDWERT